MCEAFQLTAEEWADSPALRLKDTEYEASWQDYAETVRKRAAGLAKLGVGRGDTVGFMLVNRPALHLTDAAAMHLGATCFSVYNTSSPEQVEYVVRDAENRVIVTEQAFLETVLAAREQVDDASSTSSSIDGEAPEGTISIEELEAMGEPDFDFEAAWRAVEPEDVLCLIYTSGHHRPAQGRAADPRQHGRRLAGLRRGSADQTRRADDLLPAQRPHRRPLGRALRPDDLRQLRLLLPGPARRWSPTRSRSSRPSGAGCRGSGRS